MVYEKVVSILCEQLDMKPEQISMDVGISDDLGADSLDLVEVLMSVEDEFEVELEAENTAGIFTVDEALELLEKLQQEA